MNDATRIRVCSVGLLALLLPACAHTPSRVPAGAGSRPTALRAHIQSILDTQAEAWNAGDLDRFMAYYWKSDDLTFSSSGKVTRGWQQTLDNYRRRYPTRADMGTVSFSEIEVFPLGETAALVLGGWHLDRASGPIGGKFTLVFRRIDGHWLIVHDHTSRTPAN